MYIQLACLDDPTALFCFFKWSLHHKVLFLFSFFRFSLKNDSAIANFTRTKLILFLLVQTEMNQQNCRCEHTLICTSMVKMMMPCRDSANVNSHFLSGNVFTIKENYIFCTFSWRIWLAILIDTWRGRHWGWRSSSECFSHFKLLRILCAWIPIKSS